MVVLTDRQVEHILSACRPLTGNERRMFQAALLDVLLHYREELGDGALGRLLRELQRVHFRPPVTTEDERTSSGDRHGPRPRGFER